MNIHIKCIVFFWLLIVMSQMGFAQPSNPWTPPEYAKSSAVLLEWDFFEGTWPLYKEIITHCQTEGDVILLINSEGAEQVFKNRLESENIPLNNIVFQQVPSGRIWIRDHGPILITTDSGPAFIDFDDLADSGPSELLPRNLAAIFGYEAYVLDYIMCGGNFMVDSHRTLFTTDRVYTNNPTFSTSHIQSVFKDYLGIDSIATFAPQHNDFWGHIDMQIKLLDDTTFVISSVQQGSGPNFQILEDNYQKLRDLKTKEGRPYRIEKIPMADNWKTYANAFIFNNKVLVPVYDHPLDDLALSIYRDLMPEKDVVGVNCNSIIGWEGAVHCITKQLYDYSQTVSISELDLQSVEWHIYPNPTTDFLHVNRSHSSFAVLDIYAINGILVKTHYFDYGEVESVIALSDLSSGMYIAVFRESAPISKTNSTQTFLIR